MQIVVRLTNSPFKWGIVELQGVLETHQGHSFNGLHIGDLYLDTNKGTIANMIIGHHLLTGKVITLEEPLAVLLKSSSSMTEYDITAIITQKIVFKNRPKPIISVPKTDSIVFQPSCHLK